MLRRRVSLAAGSALGIPFLIATLAGCGRAEDVPPPPPAADAGAAAEPATGGGASAIPEMASISTTLDPGAPVATVNGSPILGKRVIELAQTHKLRLRAAGGDLPVDQDLMRISLQLLIDTELMVQEARKLGLPVDSQQVEAEVQAARSQFASEDEYRKYLTEAGLADQDVRAEAERRVQQKAFQAHAVKDQVVDEAEVRKVYEQRPDLFSEGEQVRAAQILVRSSKDDSPAKKQEARARIEEAHRKLEEGGDFAAIAREYSDAQNAPNGGDLGFFPRGVMVPMFEEVAFSTKVGEFSPVFETLYGFNIIKVMERREPVLKPFEEVKPWLMVELAREKEQAAIAKKVAALRGSAEVEILVPDLDPESEAEVAGGQPGEGARP